MSTSRPRPRPGPHPTMHADLPHKWMWCDNHSQVTKWYMNVPSRPRYSIFISSFVNTANRAWNKAIDSQAKLSDLDRTIVDCLLNDPIPADVMIATLQDYNNYIGGIKGDLKQTGLISWEDEAPSKLTHSRHRSCDLVTHYAALQMTQPSRRVSRSSTT